MGFLGIDLKKIASKAAPKLIAATTIGGSKSSQTLLKNNVSAPVFQPVFDKFGSDFERGAKIAASVATVAAPVLGITKSTKSVLPASLPTTITKNILPAASDINWGTVINKGVDLVKGALNKSGSTTTPPPPIVPPYNPPSSISPEKSNMPAWLLPVAIVVGLWFLLRGKKRRR